MKNKFLIISFTSCSGCISSLISLDIFPQFLERSKIIYFPFLSDTEKIVDCDVALIEGCISEQSQIDLLKNVRKHAKKVIAMGTCAAFGGILSLSKKKKADPISDYIEIDGIIPGCPPPSKLLGNCFIRIIENKEIELSNKNLCNNCPLRGNLEPYNGNPINKIYPSNDEINSSKDEQECFLLRGILCLGPIIRAGCDCLCIELGVPCEGCMGPVSKDFTSNLINFLSLFNISNTLRKYKGIFYRFSKPKMRR